MILSKYRHADKCWNAAAIAQDLEGEIESLELSAHGSQIGAKP